MPGLGDMLYDLFSPEGKSYALPQDAGVNDIGRGPGMNYLDPMGTAAPAPQPMPQDPRMLAYQNQQNAQLAQQAWNRGPDPMSVARAGEQAPQMAPAAAGSLDPSWADALYKLMSPALQGGSAGGRRY